MSSHIRDMNDYIAGVASGKVPACKWVKLACKRHIRDIKKSKKKTYPYKFDEKKAEYACSFMELLPHVKGKWAAVDPKTKKSNLAKLEPWQKFIVC